MYWLLAALLLLPPWQSKDVPSRTSKGKTRDIRSVDFRNFDFPLVKAFWLDTPLHLRNGVQKNLYREKGDPKDSPSNGQATLEQIIYGRFNDGGEVAVVRILLYSGGSGTANELFLYQMVAGKPRLLWSFQSGDRADGGLRDVYLRKGNLVLEIYQEGADDPLCCASTFDRISYRAKAGKLHVVARERELPVPKSEFQQ